MFHTDTEEGAPFILAKKPQNEPSVLERKRTYFKAHQKQIPGNRCKPGYEHLSEILIHHIKTAVKDR